jgi:hypothetical protein
MDPRCVPRHLLVLHGSASGVAFGSPSPPHRWPGRMVLALICGGRLLFFIYQISQAINVNHIVLAASVRRSESC